MAAAEPALATLFAHTYVKNLHQVAAELRLRASQASIRAARAAFAR